MKKLKKRDVVVIEKIMLNRSNSSSKSQTRHDIYTTQSATLSHFHFPLWDLHGDTLARATPTPTPNNVYIHCAPCESMHDSERFGWKLDCKSSHIYIYLYRSVEMICMSGKGWALSHKTRLTWIEREIIYFGP